MLCMLDQITGYEPVGGSNGLGWLRGEKFVEPGEWFFKAHFFQDPVQPGSLGIEALLQLLQFHMLAAELDAGMINPRFEPIALEREHKWRYRGQVITTNKLISTTMEIVEMGHDERGHYLLGDGSLWVDGKRIYEVERMGMRLVEDESAALQHKPTTDFVQEGVLTTDLWRF